MGESGSNPWSIIMFLRQDFHFLFDGDVICGLVEGVLDRMRLVEGYPFSEFWLVAERLPERVYSHFVSYPTNSRHNEFESIHEVAERFVFSLG